MWISWPLSALPQSVPTACDLFLSLYINVRISLVCRLWPTQIFNCLHVLCRLFDFLSAATNTGRQLPAIPYFSINLLILEGIGILESFGEIQAD